MILKNEDVQMMLHMIVEQTCEYPRRMVYNPKDKSFSQSEYMSIFHERNFDKPYGWIKESGTPPEPHHDCILMSEKRFELGDEVEIKVIGVFKRADFDHKYVAVEASRNVDDLEGLTSDEMESLYKLYPRVRENEGWFGRDEAQYCMINHEKAL